MCVSESLVLSLLRPLSILYVAGGCHMLNDLTQCTVVPSLRHEMAKTWTKSSWAKLESDIATKVYTRLPCSSKFTCESVCTAWRQLLRDQPAKGIWGSRLVLTDTDKSLPSPCDPREDDSIIRLPAMSGLLLEEQIMSLCKWLKQREHSSDQYWLLVSRDAAGHSHAGHSGA